MTTSYKERMGYLLKHGVAPTNRFEVLIPVPSILQSQSSNTDNLFTDIFDNEAVKAIRSFIGSGQVENTRGLAIMCEQAPIPGKSLTTLEKRYNSDFQKIPYGIAYDDEKMVFYSSGDMAEKKLLDAWMNLIVDPNTHEVSYLREYSTNITVHQLDKNDRPVYTIILQEAYPIMVNAMDLDNSSMNEFHRINVTFAFKRYIKPEDLDTPTGIGALSQTPLGPYLTPILSNPAVQNGLDYLKEQGVDLEGEAVNIYNQVDNILKNTTGTSINKTIGILESIKSDTAGNDILSTSQQEQLSGIITDVLDKLKG